MESSLLELLIFTVYEFQKMVFIQTNLVVKGNFQIFRNN